MECNCDGSLTEKPKCLNRTQSAARLCGRVAGSSALRVGRGRATLPRSARGENPAIQNFAAAGILENRFCEFASAIHGQIDELKEEETVT